MNDRSLDYSNTFCLKVDATHNVCLYCRYNSQCTMFFSDSKYWPLFPATIFLLLTVKPNQ